ncbi:unnamed protein product, partial [Prorocentrum cordatum]
PRRRARRGAPAGGAGGRPRGRSAVGAAWAGRPRQWSASRAGDIAVGQRAGQVGGRAVVRRGREARTRQRWRGRVFRQGRLPVPLLAQLVARTFAGGGCQGGLARRAPSRGGLTREGSWRGQGRRRGRGIRSAGGGRARGASRSATVDPHNKDERLSKVTLASFPLGPSSAAFTGRAPLTECWHGLSRPLHPYRASLLYGLTVEAEVEGAVKMAGPPPEAPLEERQAGTWLDATVLRIHANFMVVGARRPGSADDVRGLVHFSRVPAEHAAGRLADHYSVGQSVRVRMVDAGAREESSDIRQMWMGGPPDLDALERARAEGLWLNATVVRVEQYGLHVQVVPPGSQPDALPHYGLVHVSEVGKGFVQDISTVAEVGDTVRVRVMTLDLDSGRVAFSMKPSLDSSTSGPPDLDALERARAEGLWLNATVVRVDPYGLQVQVVPPGSQPDALPHLGLVHVSEIRYGFVQDINAVAEVGDTVMAFSMKPSLDSSTGSPPDLDALERARAEGLWLNATVVRVEQYGLRVQVVPPGSQPDALPNHGLVHVSEIQYGFVHDISAVAEVGDTVSVRVMKVDFDSGRVAFSMKPSLDSSTSGPPDLDALERARAEGLRLNATVVRVEQYGLHVQVVPPGSQPDALPHHGLVHVSEVGKGFVQDISTVAEVGDTVSVKVMTLDRNSGRVAFSMKPSLDSSTGSPPDLDALERARAEGLWLNATVVRVEQYGLRVQVVPPGSQPDALPNHGLVHVSEIQYGFVQDISTVAEVGDTVSVKVMTLDRDSGRVEFSMKPSLDSSTSGPPDLDALERARAEGLWLNATVVSVEQFGLRAQVVPPGSQPDALPYHGLVHISEIKYGFVQDISAVAEVGDTVRVRVTGLDRDTGRVNLSMRASLEIFEQFGADEWIDATVFNVSDRVVEVQARLPGDDSGVASGIVPSRELRAGPVQSAMGAAEVGDTVRVRLINATGRFGPVFSMKPRPDVSAFAGVPPEALLPAFVVAVLDDSHIFVSVPPPTDAGEPAEGKVRGVVAAEYQPGQMVQVRVSDVNVERGLLTLTLGGLT